MQGIVAIGAWGWLDAVHLLSADTLSFLSSTITTLQGAIATGAANVLISNVEVSLNHLPTTRDSTALPFALLLGNLSPANLAEYDRGEAGFLASFLRESTRQVAVQKAPLDVLLEAALRCALTFSKLLQLR